MNMYTTNETMEAIGKMTATEADKAAALDIITGMGLPITSDNIMLAVNALLYGKSFNL